MKDILYWQQPLTSDIKLVCMFKTHPSSVTREAHLYYPTSSNPGMDANLRPQLGLHLITRSSAGSGRSIIRFYNGDDRNVALNGMIMITWSPYLSGQGALLAGGWHETLHDQRDEVLLAHCELHDMWRRRTACMQGVGGTGLWRDLHFGP